MAAAGDAGAAGAPNAGPPAPRPPHAVKIDRFEVLPSAAAGRTTVSVQWATNAATRIELWIGGVPWLCPLTSHGSRKVLVTKPTEFRLIAGPAAGPWIEAHASVLTVPLWLYVTAIALTAGAICALWVASAGFLADVSLIQSTPGWRTVGAVSKVASFLTTLVGVPVLGSLLRVWPGATSNFGIRALRQPILATTWLSGCVAAILFVVALGRSTQTVILSSQVDRTVHFLEGGKESVALAVPQGVSTAIVSAGNGDLLTMFIGSMSGAGLLDGGNRTIPPRVYAEKQGEMWILGCWSEVLVSHPRGFQATIELPEARVVPVDLPANGGELDARPSSDVLWLRQRARIQVPDCKKFPTDATLVLRDSVGAEALRVPFSLALPPERDAWARARRHGDLLVQAEIEIAIAKMNLDVSIDRPPGIGVQLSGEDGWRAAHCGRIDVAAMSGIRAALATPIAVGQAVAGELGLTRPPREHEARCAAIPDDAYHFVVPAAINGKPIDRALACVHPLGVVADTSPGAWSCAARRDAAWTLVFQLDPPDGSHSFVDAAAGIGLRELCNPATWDQWQVSLAEASPPQVLPSVETGEATADVATWRGMLAAGRQRVVWPKNRGVPSTVDAIAPVQPGELATAEFKRLKVEVGEDPWRIEDELIDRAFEPLWSGGRHEAVGRIDGPVFSFKAGAVEPPTAGAATEPGIEQALSCGFASAAEVRPQGSLLRVEKLPRSLETRRLRIEGTQGRNRVRCTLVASRGTLTCD